MLKLGVMGHIAPTYSGGDFIPPVDDAYDLGAAAQAWQDVYATGVVYTDVISEITVGAGVTIDSVLVKDGGIQVQDNGLKIENPAATFVYTVAGAAIAANRQLNLPLITGTDTLGALGLAQTWTAVQTLNSPIFVTPALGTPASGVMTNVTGVPAAAILAGSFGAGAYVVSTSLQAATIELGHATDTTLSRVSAGLIAVEGVTVVLLSGAQILTDKTLTSPTINGTIATTGLTLPAVTLGGAVTGGDQAFTNVGDMTFAAGSIIASGSTNGDTLIMRANDTAFITFTTGATDACAIANPTFSGTALASGTFTMPAFTAGGTITMGASEITGTNVLIRGGATTGVVYIIAGTSNSKDSYWSLAGWEHATTPGKIAFFTYNGGAGTTARYTFTGGLATDVLTWNAVYHVGLKFGLAGTATGAYTMDGVTSGVVTVTVAAAAGTWTMTLPTGVAGVGGYQLADAAGDGVCSWTAAASRREWKNILDMPKLSPQDALSRILALDIQPFRFKKGFGTGDYSTIYQGAMADEAPWAMHFPGEDGIGNILNPISTWGHTVQAFKAHEERIKELEDELKLLKGRA